ncbi:TPA: hypothetical protein RVS02_003762 [Aeromonas veronii]|nr:hypothetical protein [Aeromonas veronii]
MARLAIDVSGQQARFHFVRQVWPLHFFIVPVLAGKQLIAGCKKQRNCPEKSNLYGFVLELLIIFFANI